MMKRISILFLQAVIVLIGIVALTFLIWTPLTEGRATNLDAFSIYSDPFILYVYVASIAFFIILYKVFKLLSYIGQHRVFSSSSIKILKSIKYCAIVLSILIAMAGVYIRLFHNLDDDPAGFLAICALGVFVSIVIATTANVFEMIVQNVIAIKSENKPSN
jgi:hypothetical protein